MTATCPQSARSSTAFGRWLCHMVLGHASEKRALWLEHCNR